MFGLNRGQLKNGLILAFLFFLLSQVGKELKRGDPNFDYYDIDLGLADNNNNQLPSNLVLSNNRDRVRGGRQPRDNGLSLSRGDGAGRPRRDGGNKGGGPRGKSNDADSIMQMKKDQEWLRNRRAELEFDKSILNQLLWDQTLKNIRSGMDELSPLMQAPARVYPQGDPELIQLVREKYLLPPAKGPYQNIRATEDTSMGQGQLIRKLFGNKKNGIFIECGALDGETRSNTLFLEMELNWRGILIEADPVSLSKIRVKNRKAWVVPACIATRPETMSVTFGAWHHVGRIVMEDEKAKDAKGDETEDKVIEVTCIPLYSILMALDNPTIDYFSLDVEGSELAVLKTIPFDKVDIKTLSVEFFHLDDTGNANTNDELKDFMESQGYDYHSTVKARKNHANDYIFVKRGTKVYA